MGLGEPIIYDNPKIFIRQSSKEIVATIDFERSSANNSLYVFSLRDNKKETVDFLYFLCGWLNSDLITYYSQQRNIIRYSNGKQPQIKISDLGKIFIPNDNSLKKEITQLCNKIYSDKSFKDEACESINTIVYSYYGLTNKEIDNVKKSIKVF